MSNNTLTQEEKVLRKICGGAEKEKRHDSDTYHGDDELNDEKKEGKSARTEGNRSQWREKIKHEELDKELARRSMTKKEVRE